MNTPGLKLRYDEMRENNPTAPDAAGGGEVASTTALFGTPGHIRNLELVWPDGRRAFRNYSYLSGGELTTDSEINMIALYFSSDTVIIKGYALVGLFASLLDQTARQVVVSDSRYLYLREKGETTITEITFGPTQ